MRTVTRVPCRGLNTKIQPVLLPREYSPDLDNVLLGDGLVQKRGGFVPMFKDRFKMNSIRNQGFHTTSRFTTDAGSADGDFLIVPGCLVGGHRPVYEDQTAITLDFFFEIGDLTSRHGGNGQLGGLAPWNGSPYTLKVRPILSKGPIKRSSETAGNLHGNAAITWNGTVSTVWGTGASEGMPFCVYLFNNGSGTVPVWQFRLSAHSKVAGSWTLLTVTSGTTPQIGITYHIVASVTGSKVTLHVGSFHGQEDPAYTTDVVNGTVGATLATNRCPIQVFDCPQQFIEATNVGSATQRPGLNLGGATNGDYWNACKRAEGRIEDIAIWSGDKIAVDSNALDRVAKLDLAQAGNTLINYWRMLEPGVDHVEEVTGRGNHLYLVPRGPVYDKGSGGKDGASWFFNGQTSYASIEVATVGTARGDNPNWRMANNAAQTAAMQHAVRTNTSHAIIADFWVDSVEPQFEQVVAEVHSVLRLAIDVTGKLVGYCRSGGGAVGSAQEFGEFLQGPLISNVTVQPGQRYSVALVRQFPGTALELYINGLLDVSSVVIACTAESRPISGVTIGMGGYEAMIRCPTPNDNAVTCATVEQYNTDARSGFVGRVESFKIAVTSAAATLAPNYKPETDVDWLFAETREFNNPVAANRALLQPVDNADTVRSVGKGALAKIAGQREKGVPVRHVLNDVSNPLIYALHAGTIDNSLTANNIQGHTTLFGIGTRIAHVLCYFRFNQDDRDQDYSGQYVTGIEYRYANAAPGDGPGVANQGSGPKAVHLQLSFVPDELGLLGPVHRRCIEGDIPSETETVITTQLNWYTHRQRPYRFRSPKELGPTWDQGLCLPRPGQCPVSLVSDWQVQTDGRRFVIAAAGRQVYWCKPIWERESPFLEPNPQSLYFGGQPGDHVLIKASASQLLIQGTALPKTGPVVYDMWVKPHRLDGRRTILCATLPPITTQFANFWIGTVDGALEIWGTEGVFTRTWRFTQGAAVGGGAFVRPHSAMRVGAWNHVHVTIQNAPVVRINGAVVDMVDCNTLVGALKTDAFGSGLSDTAVVALYLGGLPLGREKFTTPVVATGVPVTVTTQSWAGLITEVRHRNSIDTATWPTGKSGYPPTGRSVTDASTYLLLHANEGKGWFLTNSSSINSSDNGHSQIREFIQIGNNLEQAGTYSVAAFRDRLLISNGADRVQQVIYRGLYAPIPFIVRQVGILPPAPVRVILTTATTAGAVLSAGTYSVAMSFITDDGKESDAVTIGSVTIGAVATLTIQIFNLPRSPDPQVTGRKLFVSATGGGVPLLARTLLDNDGEEHDLFVLATGGSSEAVTFGNRIVPPRARHLAITGANLVAAYLPEVEAGQNAFAFSRSDEPSYFTAASFVTIDSQDGKPIVGLRGNLGQFFLSKRDSVWALSIGAVVSAVDVQASMRMVFNSDGVGGGHATAQNLIYGAGDRGVFVFNSVEADCLTNEIEPTWRTLVDRSDDGLLAMDGAYLRARSQYWLSCRRVGTLVNDTILVLEVVGNVPGQRAWTRLTVPEHQVLNAIESPVAQTQFIVLGTTCGSIVAYQSTTMIDGTDGAANAGGAVTLAASTFTTADVLSLTLTAGSRLDVVGGGLQGTTVVLTTNVGAFTRRIVNNTDVRFAWDSPIPAFTTITFEIGGYTGRWTSPWISDNAPNREQELKRVAIETAPQAGNLKLRVASIRQGDATAQLFPTTVGTFEEFTLDMTTGWITDMPRLMRHAHGHYHRAEFRTDGINTPFSLVSYSMEIDVSVATSHTGKTGASGGAGSSPPGP